MQSLSTSPSLPSIDRFLSSIQLSQYSFLFRQNDIEMQQLLSMNENDFERLGISSFGHRKLLVSSIEHFISSIQNQYLAERQAESKEVTTKVLTGYTVFAVIVSIILQFTVHDKSLTGIWFFDGLIIAAGLAVFMSPSVVAWWRGHEYKWAILLGNIFLGGTGLGWIVCLIFALSKINPATAAILAFLSTRHKK
jgi:SAM domain (Sterile alpha motif)/Superinfection immunity protein